MPLVGTGVCTLPSGHGTFRCMRHAKVTVISRGRGSLGETVAGVQEPLGFFQVVQVTGRGFGWEQCGWRLCTHQGGFSRTAWTS